MKSVFQFFRKRAEQPVESRSYGNIYLSLSALLFIGTMWAVVNEVSTRRPWKEYQDQYFKLSEQKWNDRLNDAVSSFDSTTYEQLKRELDSADANLQTPDYLQAMQGIDKIENQLLDANRDYTFAKSRSDEAYYFWKKSIHEGHEDQGWKKKVDEYGVQMVQFSQRIDNLTRQEDSLKKIVGMYDKAVKDVRSKIKVLYTTIDNAKTKIERVHASTIKIRQVMLNDFDRSNFGTLKARIDRCQTCHAGWNDENMGDAPEPFTQHPMPELLKFHKPENFGCTPCHRGQGPGLTAGLAHGDADKYWEWPLLRGKEVYASCNNCHWNELYVQYGDRINKAKELLIESGCFGCHEIKGYTEVPRFGPELNHLLAKTKPDWIFRWVRNPKDYNPHTRMPNFRLSDDEAEDITAYLGNVAKDGANIPPKGISAGGNADHGKSLVSTVGCKGCHVIGDDARLRPARGTSYDIAPELTRAGSKLDPDWAFEWIKNPRHFRPETRMPNLRLADQEARDVVAYLMTLKDSRQFEEKTLALDDSAKIKVGEKLIRDYGCHGCHEIKGMEKEGRVSVALSNIGRKRIDEIDFGDTKISHTWDDWIYNKIKDARVYATDRIVSRMPVFAFADSEIAILRTLLRSFTKEEPGEDYQKPYDKNQQALEAGRRLTNYYHCINCHQIEEMGGAIKALLDDEGLAPPLLRPEGVKVQEQWLHDFLKGPTPIRPWLTIHMPTFSLTDSEITVVSKYFLAIHNKEMELRDYKTFRTASEYVIPGRKLFDEFQCLSCHYTGKIPEGKTPSDLAPNLAMSKNRLKPEWILDWLSDPQVIQPGTRMPSFFPDMQSPEPDILRGDAKEQIHALRDYVWTIGK